MLRVGLLLVMAAFAAASANAQPAVGDRYSAVDTLVCQTERNSDAQECLDGLRWTPEAFDVVCQPPAREREGDLLIRFPSPRPLGDSTNDLVAMEWYMVRDSSGKPATAPAVVIVHESGRGMTVGRIFARGMYAQGIHAFLLQLPGYGVRRSEAVRDETRLLEGMKQGIADVRRARDAVAVLPGIDSTIIGVQGTSLGGFVVATAAGLDQGYQRTFIMLAGGNLEKVLFSGQRDAARVRERLHSAGIEDDAIRALTRPIEPLRLAHRLSANSTWMFCGRRDDVVPPECSRELAQAAGLDDQHFIVLEADHYSGVIYLPIMITRMKLLMTSPENSAVDPAR
ncbi:MAG: hypothetical protein KDA96_20535 [Planctomycetaceae bacterium]|nr:hypothetical protein [Planctomycetaceae bacterium]